MLRSSVQYGGVVGDSGPDYLYYNADIINNQTDDQANGIAVIDPNVTFNETRDAPLIKDASDYHFSIVRFTMNGPNKDLPLFIPLIQTGTGQTNVNQTVYGAALSFQQTWAVSATKSVNLTVTPPIRYVQWSPEVKNTTLAPVPASLANSMYQGLWSSSTAYARGQIVTTAIDVQYGNGTQPYYQALIDVPAGTLLTNTTYWTTCSASLGKTQPLGTRYYWALTYQHWLDLVNTTLLDPTNLTFTASGTQSTSTCCACDTYYGFYSAWIAAGLSSGSFPYANLQAFINATGQVPQLVYTASSNLFSIYADSEIYGTRLTTFTPQTGSYPYATASGVGRIFFNTNLSGLFTGFSSAVWNTTTSVAGDGLFNGFPQYSVVYSSTASYTAGTFVAYQLYNGRPAVYMAMTTTTPGNNPITAPSEWSSPYVLTLTTGYSTELLVTNKFYTNVADYRQPPYGGSNPPLGFVPVSQQQPYWVLTQEQPSNDSLWSPISSIVFTSTLIPVKAEQTGQPFALGNGNNGSSAPTTQSAFQPIITDIALDTSASGAGGYRSFIYYAPTAEYRLSDFGASKQAIRNVDVQVYWKCRLNNQIYPIQMYNLSTVSFKMMFKKKGLHGRAERTEIGF